APGKRKARISRASTRRIARASWPLLDSRDGGAWRRPTARPSCFALAGDEGVERLLQPIRRLIDGCTGKQHALDVLDDDLRDLGSVLLRALRRIRGCGEGGLLEGLEPFVVRDEAFRDHADPTGYGLSDVDDLRLNVVLEQAHEQPRGEILVLCRLGDTEKDGDSRCLSARKR